MKGAAIALVVVGLACAASSEPRTREASSPPPPPAAIAPLDAPSQPPLNADATESVPADTPVRGEGPPVAPPLTTYRIIELKPTLKGSQVLIQVGRNSGVSKSWKAKLVDKDEKAIPRGELTIEFVANEYTRATSKLPVEKIPRDVQADVRPR